MTAKLHEVTIHQESNFSIAPRTLEEAEKFASIIASSSICPASFKGRPGDVLIILQMGYELNLKPMQALRTLGCINGIPFVYGDGLLALVKRHAEFQDIKEWMDGEISNGTLTAHCTVTRAGQEPQTRSFNIDDAKRASLWGKSGPWAMYPKRMLQHRARGFACKDVFPDALFGLLSQEEAQSITAERNVSRGTSKGMAGLKEAMGINAEDAEISSATISGADVVFHGEAVIVESQGGGGSGSIAIGSEDHIAKLGELYSLIATQEITEASIARVLKKHGVSKVEELPYEILTKWVEHLNAKEK